MGFRNLFEHLWKQTQPLSESVWSNKVNGVKKKPTPKHRPAMWENMLGTVMAMNDQGQIKYFDYDYAAAIKFAGITQKRDVRIWKADKTKNLRGANRIQKGQVVVWVE